MNNLPKVVTQQRRGRASNPRLLNRKSDALPQSHRATPRSNGQTSCVNNYFYCCIQPEDLYDAECDLCAIAKFFVTVSVLSTTKVFNPLLATLKPQSNGPSYSNTVIGTLAVDGWAVAFGT